MKESERECTHLLYRAFIHLLICYLPLSLSLPLSQHVHKHFYIWNRDEKYDFIFIKYMWKLKQDGIITFVHTHIQWLGYACVCFFLLFHKLYPSPRLHHPIFLLLLFLCFFAFLPSFNVYTYSTPPLAEPTKPTGERVLCKKRNK